MKKLFAVLFSAWLLALVGLVALALVIWFIGPLVSIGTVAPLASEEVRWIVIAALFVAWIARML